MIILYAVACALSATFWRMGGAAGHSKLWRRIGCTFILFAILLIHSNMSLTQSLISLAMIAWGCWSYFGWINFWTSKEYWYNFLVGALLIQCSILIESFSSENLATAFVFALLGALGKVWIDKDVDGWKQIFWGEGGIFSILKVRKDVLSECYFGLIMCAGVIVNATVTLF